MPAGAQWPSQLAQALSCCRVFVPLYSPRYFESEECGKEWSAFSRRVETQAAKRDKSPVEVIVPALWVPVDPERLPQVARSIQFSHHSLGARYSQEGFWGIMKVRRYRDDYEIAVLRLAQHIVQVVERTMLEREIPADYHSLTSAFDERVITTMTQLRPETAKQSGRRIHIVVAAPTVRDLPEGRSPVYYGESEREWDPYLPESQAALADFAADLTSRLGYRPVIVPFDELPSIMVTEPIPAAPGLFLVDPWTTAIDGQATRLRQYDEQAERWISVLVPWNRADRQTMAAESTLRPEVGDALSHMLDRAPPEYRQAASRITTLAEFADILPSMAHIANNRFLRNATAYPPGGPAIPRPRLAGPYPSDSEETP